MSGFISYLTRGEVEAGKETFKSYINIYDDEEGETENDDELDKRASTFFTQTDLAAPLLPGERVVIETDSVLSFTPFTDRKKGIAGKLFVTNFRVSFVTADRSSYEQSKRKKQRNILVEDTDIPLTFIDSIYQVVSGGRRKKLLPGSTVSNITKYLEIHCKDFSVHTFGFKPKEQNKKTVNAVVHHAYPSKSTLLFAFDYGKNLPYETYKGATLLYEDGADWERELESCKCTKWWVTDVNQGFGISLSLPKRFVVPCGFLNADLTRYARHFVEGRVPTWSYTHTNGSSLVRMAAVVTESSVEKDMLSAIQLADHNRGPPALKALEDLCPSIKEVQSSFEKLKELCFIESRKDFLVQDTLWMSSLDNTRWLQHVAQCLKVSVEVVNTMVQGKNPKTVVIKENDSRHFTCLVASLVQIMLNPHCRTQVGFQCLIQKEWVVMGYPFQKYHGLIIQGVGEEVPLFLLFLDCVWQMMLQFPSSFAFSETFLTTLWDSTHVGLFDTFLFDSQHEKNRFANDGRYLKKFRLPSVWDWDFQFSAETQLFFNNPLYLMKSDSNLRKALRESKRKVWSTCQKMDRNQLYTYQLNNMYTEEDNWTDEDRKQILLPEFCAPLIKLWSQCYLRWQSPAQIIGGGNPSQYVHQCLLVEEIIHLQHRLNTLDPNSDIVNRPSSDLIFSLAHEMAPRNDDPKSPNILEVTCLSSSFPFTVVPESRDTQFTFTPISAYLENSAIEYDYQNASD